MFKIPPKKTSVVTLKLKSGEEIKVSVDVAATAVERELGLMYREELPEGQGMLFVFPGLVQDSVWMKNTAMALDLIFEKDGKIVDIIPNARPFSEELLLPQSAYRRFLEVPAGFVARHGIQKGDEVVVHSIKGEIFL